MKQQFTNQDMIRDIYGESDYLEQMAMQNAKKNNPDFRSEYQSFQKAEALLSSVDIAPPASIIQNILNYSASSQFETEVG
jgi:hypothetical protein